MRKPLRDSIRGQLAADFLATPLAMARDAVEQWLAGLRADQPLRKRDVVAGLFADGDEDDGPALDVDADGVATIHVQGVLRKHARWYDRYSGVTAYETLLAQIGAAAEAAHVRGVLLRIDSPGGNVQGLFEVADALAALGRVKPLHAVADETMASAAYLLGSQASRLTVPKTGILGSVGVISVRFDATGADERLGYAFHFVTSGARKGDGDPDKATTDAELASMQRKVDAVAAEMFTRVAAGRKTTPAAIEALEADTFMGRDGLERGLADAVGTVDEARAALVAAITRTSRRGLGAGAEETTMSDERTGEETQEEQAAGADHPATEAAAEAAEAAEGASATTGAEVIDFQRDPRVKQARDAAAAEAQQAERTRAAAIVAACTDAARLDLVAALQADDSVTAANAVEKVQAARADESDRTALRTGVGPAAASSVAAPMKTQEALARWQSGNAPTAA